MIKLLEFKILYIIIIIFTTLFLLESSLRSTCRQDVVSQPAIVSRTLLLFAAVANFITNCLRWLSQRAGRFCQTTVFGLSMR